MADFEGYLKLKMSEKRDLSRYLGININYAPKRILKREFKDALNSIKKFLLIAEEDKEIIGYLEGVQIIDNYQKTGYIYDIFILKEYRKKRFAIDLIGKFTNLLKKRKIHKIKLGVNPKNKRALNLYRKLGFKIAHYEMEKKIK